jgi:hypothetical protein
MPRPGFTLLGRRGKLQSHAAAGGGSPRLEPGQHVRSVNPATDDLDLCGHREHATKPALAPLTFFSTSQKPFPLKIPSPLSESVSVPS